MRVIDDSIDDDYCDTGMTAMIVILMMMILIMKSFLGMTAMFSTITGQREPLVTPSESRKSGEYCYL